VDDEPGIVENSLDKSQQVAVEKIGVKGLSMFNRSANNVMVDDMKNGKAQTCIMSWIKPG
jgi:hypothetical protein